MPTFGDVMIKAQLTNGKFIIIDKPKGMTAGWRYVTPSEMDSGNILTRGIFNWKTANIQNAVRGGRKIWFIVVEDTNIILNGYFE